MSLEQRLAELGLEGKLVKFYLAALKLGTAPVQIIAKEAGISRTTAYDVLGRLLEEGLVARIEKEGVTLVVAEDPNILLESLEERQRRLRDVLPELRSIYNRSGVKPRVRFYEGVEGIKTVMRDVLACKTTTVRGILSMAAMLEAPGLDFMNDFIASRIMNGKLLRVVRSKSEETAAIWLTDVPQLRELRHAPTDTPFLMTTFLYDDKACFISSRRERFGIIIESNEFAGVQKQLFELLWNSSSPDNDDASRS